MDYNKNGLTANEAEQSRIKNGINVLTPPKRESMLKLYLEKFSDPIIRILLIAAALSLVISVLHGSYTETIGIFVAIFLATGVGFWFEWDAARKFDILNSVTDQTLVRVMRSGSVTEQPKADIAVGDVVLLETGEEVPADGELVESMLLTVNESSLTGEPSISKTTNPSLFKKDVTYPSNRVLRSSTVLEGSAIMVVDKVGDDTEIGHVAKASTEKSGEKTPLTKQLEKLATMIGSVGFILSTSLFFILLARNIFSAESSYSVEQVATLLVTICAVAIMIIKIWMPLLTSGVKLLFKSCDTPAIVEKKGWLFWIAIGLGVFVVAMAIMHFCAVGVMERGSWVSLNEAQTILGYFMIAVTMIVVAVPEGLPMSVNLSLALNMRRMLKSNNLVRKMHASETMGAINIICTDKTGTLTQNRMQVRSAIVFGGDSAQSAVLESIAANSTAHLEAHPSASSTVIGNPTEGALLLWIESTGAKYSLLREQHAPIDRLSFSTERKFMGTMVESKSLGKRVIYIKGAPEIIISKCSHISHPDGTKEMHLQKEEVTATLLEFQNQAMRTLAMAYKVVDATEVSIGDNTSSGYTLIAITAIADPLREDVSDAVGECLSAGIDVKIVTGDTPATAKEIGRQVGLWRATTHDSCHITGADFEALSDAELLDRVLDIKIMSRARPTDKQRFVKLLQQKGGVVAVTGDGTNDAPALNFAHVGLSMGSGTSVAKEASDITLLDDSFNSIVSAVMWGRSLYKNIQRFLLFQLTINVVAIVIVFVGSFVGGQSPLTITQMLWVNIIMDTFAAAALASLPPSKKVMKDKPRKDTDFIITRSMAINILGVGVAMVVGLLYLLDLLSAVYIDAPLKGLTLFFSVFVLLQLWNMFNAKAFGTSHSSAFKGLKQSQGFVLVALLILAGQILIVSTGGKMFRVEPLSPLAWLVITSSTASVLAIGEIARLINRVRAKKVEQ